MCVCSTASIAGMFSQSRPSSARRPDRDRGAVGRNLDPPVAESELVAGALIEIVPPFAPVVCEREIGPVPTNTSRVPVTPVFPAVFPSLDIPAENPPPPPSDDGDRAAVGSRGLREGDVVGSDQHQLCPVIPVAPAVLPRLEAPALIAPAPRFGAEMVIVVAPAAVDLREGDVVPACEHQPRAGADTRVSRRCSRCWRHPTLRIPWV